MVALEGVKRLTVEALLVDPLHRRQCDRGACAGLHMQVVTLSMLCRFVVRTQDLVVAVSSDFKRQSLIQSSKAWRKVCYLDTILSVMALVMVYCL